MRYLSNLQVPDILRRLILYDRYNAMGFGTDHLCSKIRDWPLAYANYLLYASNILNKRKENLLGYETHHFLYIIRRGIDQLSEIAKASSKILTGLGIPVPRHTFRTGQLTEANYPMIVPSSFGILGICDGFKYYSDLSHKNLCIKIATEISKTFLDNSLHISPQEGTWIGYSAREDHFYPVMNANALFAGAIATLAATSDCEEMRNKYFGIASDIITYVLEKKQTNDNIVSWKYYGHTAPDNAKSKRANDLLHESYTWYGLQRYYQAVNSESGLKFVNIYAHKSLERFLNTRMITELPSPYINNLLKQAKSNEKSFNRLTRPARLWSLAAALSVIGRNGSYGIIDDTENDDAYIKIRILEEINTAILGRCSSNRTQMLLQPRHYSSLLWGLSEIL